jgi:hypothetical protein
LEDGPDSDEKGDEAFDQEAALQMLVEFR